MGKKSLSLQRQKKKKKKAGGLGEREGKPGERRPRKGNVRKREKGRRREKREGLLECQSQADRHNASCLQKAHGGLEERFLLPLTFKMRGPPSLL